MNYIVFWDDESDRDFAQVCPGHELDLFLKELPDLYNDAKNIRVLVLTDKVGQLVSIHYKNTEP